LKKAHYKFFYSPVHKYNLVENYVLLDILFEEPHYAKVINWPVASSFVKQDGDPLMVKVPCHEDILGDKLTAFAPNTTGIPYEKNGDLRTMEIMKQLYDIGSLMNVVDDMSIISQTFAIFAQTELGYRNCEAGVDGVLYNIYQTALLIAAAVLKAMVTSTLFQKVSTRLSVLFSPKVTILTALSPMQPKQLTCPLRLNIKRISWKNFRMPARSGIGLLTSHLILN